ncbi:MAG: TetR/AcrR family transcriptional regulator [Candidatus Gastranaerophilales bacterium]|nr:TetR/AcrR family transcriptional regulator [Candidatus Gastranaerophilales bacterium]
MKNEVMEFKRKLILEVAAKHFKTLGYEKTQIDKIAKELNVGVGTIYSIFGSKEGIFASYIYSVVDNAFLEIKSLLQNVEQPFEKLKIFVSYKFSYYEKNKAIIRDYLKNNPFFMQNTQKGALNPMKGVYTLVAQIIEDYVHNKKNVITNDYYLLALTLDGMISSFIERFSGEDVDLNSLTPKVLNLFDNAIGACQ